MSDNIRISLGKKIPTAQSVYKLVEKEAEEELKKQGVVLQLGYCHSLWELMKKNFKKKYGIDWKSPAETNPGIMYD